MVPSVASPWAKLSAYISALQKRAPLNLEFTYGREHILAAKFDFGTMATTVSHARFLLAVVGDRVGTSRTLGFPLRYWRTLKDGDL